MPQEEHKTVFISYRRKIGSHLARLIYKDLRKHNFDVFMDVESLDAGKFETIILNQIKERVHFLVILLPGSLDGCENPNDWVRREIEFAIEHQRNIVPIMGDGFRFEDYREQLVGQLSELPHYNDLNVPNDYFDAAMGKLRARFLKQSPTELIQSTPIGDEKEVLRKLRKSSEPPTPAEKEAAAYKRLLRGTSKQAAGKLDEAIADYDEAIRLNPKLNLAYHQRGTARARQGNLLEAIADYNQAIQLSPQHGDAYFNRGIAKFHQNDLVGAIADFAEVINLNSQDADAYDFRGRAYFVHGQFKLALIDFEKSAALSPDDINIAGRAVTLHALGQNDKAIYQWQELLKKDTHYRDADWVGQEQRWHPALVEEARKLIESL